MILILLNTESLKKFIGAIGSYERRGRSEDLYLNEDSENGKLIFLWLVNNVPTEANIHTHVFIVFLCHMGFYLVT